MWIQNFEFHFFPGTDEWEYEWIDEGSTDAHPITNGDGGAQSPGDDVIRKKSVSFTPFFGDLTPGQDTSHISEETLRGKELMQASQRYSIRYH